MQVLIFVPNFSPCYPSLCVSFLCFPFTTWRKTRWRWWFLKREIERKQAKEKRERRWLYAAGDTGGILYFILNKTIREKSLFSHFECWLVCLCVLPCLLIPFHCSSCHKNHIAPLPLFYEKSSYFFAGRKPWVFLFHHHILRRKRKNMGISL